MQDLTTGNCSDIITVTDNALLGTKLRMRPLSFALRTQGRKRVVGGPKEVASSFRVTPARRSAV